MTEAQQPGAADRIMVALAWINAGRERDKFLGPLLFSDPAWEMLLDLYVNHCRRRPVSVMDLCIASGVPTTSAHRWIGVLEGRQFICRKPDPFDRRRFLISFTDLGLAKMEAALDGATRSDRRLGLGRLATLE